MANKVKVVRRWTVECEEEERKVVIQAELATDKRKVSDGTARLVKRVEPREKTLFRGTRKAYDLWRKLHQVKSTDEITGL